ncbi:GNAT family N-acetyltransferase [Frankia sp. CNm7]|uniref:GNAT family N-acetyltransferase n=1 Tax=Frankia nepalensis TaxID=1836974 RepID=A0A937URS1_9ACTN|nr:GNAT family N-acetyltransferase [Frankia nepalensis]MBL7498105.1 GNAT family N-acetyltransferase [Frankia nepalensis]MBL7509280.1 GNAT family N-acetyltransferase [Frankia nepalensis]MBL7524490.1 GNAT family N-acetyltransferase [Frankia nepalensis]MBL7633134.1 GNAT family N-acetyltransferase [Frankia nepalensis]
MPSTSPPSPATAIRIASRYAAVLDFEIHSPAGWGSGSEIDDTTLAALRAFRAEVLWSDGRRPAFRSPDNQFVDADESDPDAFHLALRDRADGTLVGYVRAIPAERCALSSPERLIGAGPVSAALAAHGATRADILDTGRLVVAGGRRGKGTAPLLVAALVALGRDVDRPMMLCAAGTRDGQHLLYQRLGYTPMTSCRVPSDRYDDDMCPMLRDARRRIPGVDILAEQFEEQTGVFRA